MQIFHDSDQLKNYLSDQRSRGKSIGFVPTMGALHQGHLALVNKACGQNDIGLVSIFVNPTQFNNASDLQTYPREPEKDIEKLGTATPCQAVYLPEVSDIYPNGPETETIPLGNLTQNMEGSHRPGHFEGVATVVKRFFNIIRPTRAYFGEKDFQQLAVIRHMVDQLNLPVEVIGHPTERSTEGLALSSRNQLLTDRHRKEALVIIEQLRWIKQQVGKKSPGELKKAVQQRFSASPLQLEYAEIADPASLKPLAEWHHASHARAFIAAHISGVRLIDNLSLF